MRIACVQFDPQLMDVPGNQARAEALIAQRVARGCVDLLLMPEMAFTGYCFKDRTEILPYCELAENGPTASWCQRTARRLDCVVVAGFPERGRDGRLFNSLLAVDAHGAVRHVHRKHFLYTTDESWATEGPAFTRSELPGLGRCAFGICMDVNPHQFKAPIDRFEFASSLFTPPLGHHELPEGRRLNTDVVILAANWLRNPADAELGDEEHCRHLVNYWAYRLSPALAQPVVVAIANRVGVERDARFAGCSCVIDLRTQTLLGRLNGIEEDVLVVDDVPHYAFRARA